MNTHTDPRQCPLNQEWRAWSSEKCIDRAFMTCPACGRYGSHVGEDAAGKPAAWSPARGWAARARAGQLVSKDMTGGAA